MDKKLVEKIMLRSHSRDLGRNRIEGELGLVQEE
jgi:hypothetical protein